MAVALLATHCDRKPATPDADSSIRESSPKVTTTASVDLPDFAGLYAQISPSVVNIAAAHPLPVSDRFLPQKDRRPFRLMAHSLGSGFVIDAQGHLVTCASVVQDADRIRVIRHDGREQQARLVAVDPFWDLAVLAVAPDPTLVPLLPAEERSPQLGERVAAFGYPFGLSHSITAGTVCAFRSAKELGGPHGLIATDAAVNPGCNGGPLLDKTGRLLGINLVPDGAIRGVGLAIPIHDALPVIEQLINGHPAAQPWLGWSTQRLDDALADSFGLARPRGALINELVDTGPGAKAGVQIGDVCLELNGKPVRDPFDLQKRIRQMKIGQRIQAALWRAGRRIRLSLVAASAPQPGQSD